MVSFVCYSLMYNEFIFATLNKYNPIYIQLHSNISFYFPIVSYSKVDIEATNTKHIPNY